MLPLVENSTLDLVVVDPDPLVWVANREIHSQVVVEVSVGQVELSESDIGGVQFHGVRAKDEPADDGGDCDDNEDEAKDLAEAGAEAVHDGKGFWANDSSKDLFMNKLFHPLLMKL